MPNRREREGRKIRALTSVIDLLMQEVEELFLSTEMKSLPEAKADILREILWRNLDHAFREGENETHGLELKIQFLERLLEDRRKKDELE